MTPERWRQIDDLFNEASELPPGERSARLDVACAGDAELRAEVESLLAASGEADASIQGAIQRRAEIVRESGALLSSPMGRHIGPYRVLRELGEGGMGAVYLAVRDDDEYRTEVAIKLLHRGLETAQAVARFRDERQILATLAHPGIVRMLDGGSTDEGLPYLVMEHVDGLPITRFADERGLSVAERLALLRKVCAAVTFAHQRLVVHRDIKPSNVLVTADGTPKLLDFGIAKLLDPEAGREARTRTGMRLLTPEYASPEQVTGAPASTSTDVYSLGAVLYELLTGAPAQTMKGEGAEALRAMLEVDPPRPSLIAPKDRRRALVGDVDSIVLKALRKEPASRYASVEQLSLDIGRHLDGLPVQARSGTFTYRAGKFLRRSRGALAALGLVLASLSAATAVSVRQARLADQQAARAQRRFNDVRRLAKSMVFEIDGAIQDLDGSTAARELIVSRALEYLDGLASDAGDDPALSRELAAAYMKIGDIQGNSRNPNLGRPNDGLASYAKASQIVGQLAASGHNDEATRWAQARALVGTAHLRWTLGEAQAVRDGLRAATEIIKSLPEDGAFDYRLAAQTYMALFEVESQRAGGDIEVAALYADACLDVATRWSRADPSSAEARYWMGIARSVRGLGSAALGDPDGAIRSFDQSIDVFSSLVVDYPEKASYRRELSFGRLMAELGAGGIGQALSWFPCTRDFDEAERQVREAIPLLERFIERDAKDVRSRQELLNAETIEARLQARRDPGAALPAFQRALELLEAGSKEARSDMAMKMCERGLRCSMAEPLARLGRRDNALAATERGLAVAVGDADDEARWSRWWCLYEGARARRALGDRAEAQRALEEAALGLRGEIAASPRLLPPYIGAVEALELLAELQDEAGCEPRKQAADLWRSWPGKPTPYTKRRQGELDEALGRCLREGGARGPGGLIEPVR